MEPDHPTVTAEQTAHGDHGDHGDHGQTARTAGVTATTPPSSATASG
jgi:hypothetical protein